jgi:hypothetical protein
MIALWYLQPLLDNYTSNRKLKQVGISTGNAKACTNNLLLSKLNEIPTGILQIVLRARVVQ